jgi:cystathionine beta-lyase
VQTPIYPPFVGAVTKQGGGSTRIRSRWARAVMRSNLERLRSETDARTRILLLCNPHNPTGRAFRREELEALAAIALERDWWVVADEIHQDLVYAGHRHVPFASLSPRSRRARSRSPRLEGVQHRWAALRRRDLRIDVARAAA